MPQPPSTLQRTAWQGDPQRDFIIYHLIRLARSALLEHFNQGGAEEAYVKWHDRQEQRRRRDEKPRELARWDDEAGCNVTLIALSQRNRFRVAANDAGFTAEVSVTYDPEIYELEAASVTSFAGDIADAIESIDNRVDAWQDMGDLGLDLDDLFAGGNDDADDFEPDDDDADEADEAGSAPPDVTPDEIEVVRRMARRLGRHFADDKAPDLSDQDQDWLENTPQSLWAILDGTLAVARKQPRDDSLLSAWRFLLSNQLELIRYRAERAWPWADAMLNDYQDRIIALAREGGTDGEVLFMLVAALNHAKIAVRPELGEALVNSDPDLPALRQSPEALGADLRAAIDELARQVDTPFETAEALAELTTIAPPDVRAYLAHELALSPHAILRDTVPLMLLDGLSEVRRAAAAALEQIAAPETLSPASLRRIIALRNWIPEPDRPAVDQAIRKARVKGIEIAQWNKPPDLAFHASPLDGSGAQSLLVVSRSGRMGLFCGVLTKQQFGVRDAWWNQDMPRREIASGLAEVQRTVVSPEVERDYFDVTVQHYIAVGLANDNLPSAEMLELAEAIGAADWKDRRIDTASEIDRLFLELPAAERSAEAIGAVLRRTGAWAQRDRIAETWFGDDADIRDTVGAFKGRDATAASRALLDGPLAAQRDAWTERCLLMALWSRAIRPGAKGPPWRDFLVLAHELQTGRKLAEIPLMMQVAERTVAAAKSRAW